jgi:hypothetical protein
MATLSDHIEALRHLGLNPVAHAYSSDGRPRRDYVDANAMLPIVADMEDILRNLAREVRTLQVTSRARKRMVNDLDLQLRLSMAEAKYWRSKADEMVVAPSRFSRLRLRLASFFSRFSAHQ